MFFYVSRWWQLKYFLVSIPKIGGKWSNLTSKFSRWIGSTTNGHCQVTLCPGSIQSLPKSWAFTLPESGLEPKAVSQWLQVRRFFVFFGIFGCFHKWWYPTTIGFPTKNDHFGVFWGYHHLRKHPYEGFERRIPWWMLDVFTKHFANASRLLDVGPDRVKSPGACAMCVWWMHSKERARLQGVGLFPAFSAKKCIPEN